MLIVCMYMCPNRYVRIDQTPDSGPGSETERLRMLPPLLLALRLGVQRNRVVDFAAPCQSRALSSNCPACVKCVPTLLISHCCTRSPKHAGPTQSGNFAFPWSSPLMPFAPGPSSHQDSPLPAI